MLQPAWIAYGAAIALYALVFAVLQVDPLPPSVHLAGVLVAALCGLPLAVWYRAGMRRLPMFELICLAYGVQYSVPLYLQPNWAVYHGGAGTIPLAWESTLRALLLTALGVLMLQLGYYVTRWRAVWLPRLDLPLRPALRPVYLAYALGVGLGIMALQSAGVLPGAASRSGSLVTLVKLHVSMAIVLLAYHVYATRPARVGWLIPLWLAVAAAALLGLTTGMMQDALIPLVLVLVVRWQVRRRIPWRFLLAGFVLFAVLQPLKLAYRSQAWHSPVAPTLTERIGLWRGLAGTLVDDVLSGYRSPLEPELLSASMIRLDLLHNFAHVVDTTPRIVDYYGGETYSYLLVGWVPRFLWPEKPIAQQANITFALDYGILEPWQIGLTMTGIGHVAEAYANFGTLGVMLVMLVQGVVFGVLDRMLNGPRSDGGRAIYFAVMVFFLNGIGSATAGLFGALFQNIIASALIVRVFATGFSAKPD